MSRRRRKPQKEFDLIELAETPASRRSTRDVNCVLDLLDKLRPEKVNKEAETR